MTKEEEELMIKQIMVNQQLLKAIIILLSPSRSDGIKIIQECQKNIEDAFNKTKEGYKNEI